MRRLNERLEQQVRFTMELDKLKLVLRRNTLGDSSRFENSAEHSWHLAVMAAILVEYANGPIDLGRVIQMVLVHDIVEIDAGDTFAYDEVGILDQAARESLAADRLFALLPPDQTILIRGLWEEFEARDTEDARFAVALDRFQPLLQNIAAAGGSWRAHAVSLEMVRARCVAIGEGSAALGAYVETLIADAVSRGMIAVPGIAAP
ncbi:MAG TPA: HD domain-containing protein [Chloroflexota bacterium]|nr:HD domain-containing protein [Chloroflexota bacterium]